MEGTPFSCLWHLYHTATGILSSEWAPCQTSRWAGAESCQKTVCASSFKYWRLGLPSERAVRADHTKLFCLGLKNVSYLFQLRVINFESQTVASVAVEYKTLARVNQDQGFVER